MSSAPLSEQYRLVAKEFEARISPEPNSGCWLWVGSYQSKPKRYGIFSYRGVNQTAHRAAWTIYRGPIPDGLCVLHKCDVPECVNPSHLFIGTQLDNVNDRQQKGRSRGPRGELAGLAKLTSEDVRAIRALRVARRGLLGVAYRYGVSKSTISKVILGKTWTHV